MQATQDQGMNGRRSYRCRVIFTDSSPRQCDQIRPACQNCIKFRVACVFMDADSPSLARQEGSLVDTPDPDGPSPSTATIHPGRQHSMTMAAETGCASSPLQKSLYPLSIVDTELLLHFTSRTGPSLVTAEDMAQPMTEFWTCNVPMMGLSHHYVLHLALALAARHMLRLGHGGAGRQRELSALADHHLSAGLAETLRALPHLSRDNCGPLYVAAMLISLGSLAAGPSGPDDLLLSCTGAAEPMRRSWIQISRGVRSIRDSFSRAVIFSGLAEPLRSRTSWHEGTPYRPTCLRQGFPRLDWTGPLRELRRAIETRACGDAAVHLDALSWISAIYEATYGLDDTGRCTVDPVFRHAFIWLYYVDDGFITHLQEGDSASLLILVYYALLVDNVRDGWFWQGWTEHLFLAAQRQMEPDWSPLLRWPLEVLRLGGRELQSVQNQ